ncbi:acetylornithine deacetylase [Yeosuana aromativorans]|uniref:Acetylornithine deacetylase n=1 Tax=Yeosuana aromativorans TaxID=288019 RepID=A0A8J3FFG5_9FLAO|nr:acetylornithine deacetylase [Yeosuana aromativorans]GGK20251.1 acetylornithine deacetylase [Yeosuana aromativorans]
MTVETLLEKLIAFPVLGGEPNLDIINWIKEYVEGYGVSTTLVFNEKKDKASLHCRIGPAVDGGVILSGHTDVIPVEGQDWKTDPFKLVDKGDGKLYARGSCDMKGFIACCLAVLPKMIKSNLKVPIYFAFSYDEEIGCLGAPELIESIQSTYIETPQYAIIGEPTMLQPIIGQKGIYILDITINGSAGHSSRIKQEVSAVHEAARLTMWAEENMQSRIDLNKLDVRFDPPHSSLHVGIIKGGIAPNIIADKAFLTLDIRSIPQDNALDIFKELKMYCQNRERELRPIFPEFKITLKENHPPVPPLNTDENDDVVALLRNITGNHEWSTVSYASEAGQFAKAGFRTIICGPGSIEQAHRANEFISKDQLHKGVLMIKQLVKELENPNS